MPRAAPKAWEAGGIELLRVQDICGPTYIGELIDRHLGGGSDQRNKWLKAKLTDCLGAYRVRLHYRCRPVGKSVSAAIRRFHEAAEAAKACLEHMDDASLEELADEAHRPDHVGIEVIPHLSFVSAAQRQLCALSSWAEKSNQSTRVGRSGRPTAAEARKAAEGLLWIWMDPKNGKNGPKGRNPSANEFVPFVVEALTPIQASYADKIVPENLTHIASVVLKEAPQPRRKMGTMTVPIKN